jgi:tRNA 2-selenouridine synthase SelU
MPYKPYVPQDVGELLDQLAYMMLSSPTFKDKTGYLPHTSIDTAFFSLNEGLLAVREKLGEQRYVALRAMSDKMRALFEADPEDETGDTHAGCMLIQEMEDLLTSFAKKVRSK